MCDQNVQLIANNGSANITIGNSSLTGASGTITQILIAGSGTGAGGTTVRSVTIKATGNTSLGMIRLFINNGTAYFLYREVMVPANDQTGVVPAFSYVVTEPVTIQPGYFLFATTQNSESFNIIANGQDIINCSC